MIGLVTFFRSKYNVLHAAHCTMCVFSPHWFQTFMSHQNRLSPTTPAHLIQNLMIRSATHKHTQLVLILLLTTVSLLVHTPFLVTASHFSTTNNRYSSQKLATLPRKSFQEKKRRQQPATTLSDCIANKNIVSKTTLDQAYSSQNSFTLSETRGGQSMTTTTSSNSSNSNNNNSNEGSLAKLRRTVFPMYGKEVNKFLLLGSFKFFIIMALTLTRDTKDTLVVTQCGAEAIAFLKVCTVNLSIVLLIKNANVDATQKEKK